MNQTKSKSNNNQPTRPASIPRHCRHIMTNGEFCRALALRGRPYCHFHSIHLARKLRAQRRYEIAINASIEPQCIPMDLPLLEDANSIQLAISHVVDALMNNSLDTKRAGLVLYALQTATLNLANGVDFTQHDDASLAEEYDNLEQDLQLGNDAPELKLPPDHAPKPQPAAPPPAPASRPATSTTAQPSPSAAQPLASASRPESHTTAAPAAAASFASPPRPAPARSQPDPVLLNRFFDALPRPHVQDGKVVLRAPKREPKPAV